MKTHPRDIICVTAGKVHYEVPEYSQAFRTYDNIPTWYTEGKKALF